MFDGNLQIPNLADKVELLTPLFLCLQLVLVELLCAEIFVLVLIIFLCKELCNHVIDGLFHMSERIMPDLVRQRKHFKFVEACRANDDKYRASSH